MSSEYQIDGSNDLYRNGMVIVDRFFLKNEPPVEMEVRLGEDPGEGFFCQLLLNRPGSPVPPIPNAYADAR